MEKKDILIFGAGGHASKLIEIIEEQGRFNIKGYISTETKGVMINNYPVLGSIDDYAQNTEIQDKYYHIAIGENSVRNRISREVNALRNNRGQLVSLISSHSVISPDAVIEPGTAVAHNAVVWNRVKIGTCCIIDTGAIVEHDAVIGDFVNISPGAVVCGGVKIDRGAVVGAGAVIIEKVKIGENTLVGAGSVVINDIQPDMLVVGNPARVVRKRKFNETYLR